MSDEFTIQSALYSVLSSDAGLTALGPTVVDFGPSEEDASGLYPYVAIGGLIFDASDTDNTTGFDMAGRVHTWGNNGAKQVRDIQGAMYDALHLQALTVTGFNSVLLYRESSQIMRAASGAFHGVCEYRWLLTRTA